MLRTCSEQLTTKHWFDHNHLWPCWIMVPFNAHVQSCSNMFKNTVETCFNMSIEHDQTCFDHVVMIMFNHVCLCLEEHVKMCWEHVHSNHQTWLTTITFDDVRSWCHLTHMFYHVQTCSKHSWNMFQHVHRTWLTMF